MYLRSRPTNVKAVGHLDSPLLYTTNLMWNTTRLYVPKVVYMGRYQTNGARIQQKGR